MKIEYEKETCGRCGGSGHFSYNQITGTRCFGCEGSGERYTKRGAAALKFAQSLADRTVADVKVGDVVLYNNGGRITVQAIETGVSMGHSLMDKETGEFVPIYGIKLTGPKHSHTFNVDTTVRVPLSVEQAQEVIDYQTNLTKAGKPRKRRVSA